MVILLSVGSWEVRVKANTRNLLHFQVSCTRANLPYANLFKCCSYKYHLKCYQGGGRSWGLCCLRTDPDERGLFSRSPGANIAPHYIFFFISLSNLLYLLFILFLSRTKYPNIRVEISVHSVLLCCLLCEISNAGQKEISNYQPFSRVHIIDIIFKI